MLKPNWENSILNVSATFSEFLGNKNDIPKISILQEKLKQDYKNVVFVCMDGFGLFPMKQNLNKNSFLIKNIKKKITSVFPSTTTNATSTLYSATYPMDHGMFGWSLYIEELDRNVDIYIGRDSNTGEKIDKEFVNKKLAFDYYFNHSNGKITTNAVLPFYVEPANKNSYPYEKKEQMFDLLEDICKKKGKQFVYAYAGNPDGEPDHTMHIYGVTSKEAKEIIACYNAKFEEFANKHKDTLIVITCDHGQTDITDYIELYKDKELLSTLEKPAYLEARAVSFIVKPNMEEKFKKEIKKYKQLKLYKTEDLIKKNFFGPKTEKAKLLGDYIAIVKNNHTQVLINELMPRFKGHHTALTKREMLLPLIILN